MSLDLDAIKARCEAATHVSAERVQWNTSGPVVGYYHGGRWFVIAECQSWEDDDTDLAVADFIAAARTDVPALITEVRNWQETWLRQALRAVFNVAVSDVWLNTPKHGLGGRRPVDLIGTPDFDAVAEIVDQLTSRAYA